MFKSSRICLVICGLTLLSNPLQASCYYKKVGPAKIKICNIGDDPAAALAGNYKDLQDNFVAIWHDAYGVLPDYTREVLNEHFLTGLSLYFATLPVALLLEATQDIYQIWENGARQVKDAEASDTPEFVLKAIVKIAGRATDAATEFGRIYGVGSDAYRSAISALNELQEEYSQLARAAKTESEAVSIEREFTAKTWEL